MAKKKKVNRPQAAAASEAAEMEPAPRAEAPRAPEPARISSPEAKFALIDDERSWKVGAGVVIAIAVFLRFFELTLKPLHHDEGVNGFFLKTLFYDGTYKYD